MHRFKYRIISENPDSGTALMTNHEIGIQILWSECIANVWISFKSFSLQFRHAAFVCADCEGGGCQERLRVNANASDNVCSCICVFKSSLYLDITTAQSSFPEYIVLSQHCSTLSVLPFKYYTSWTHSWYYSSLWRLSSHFLLFISHTHFLSVFKPNVTFSFLSFKKCANLSSSLAWR